MIAKVVTQHYDANNDSRFIDIGDDFKVYSTTYGRIFNRYSTYTSKLSNKKDESNFGKSQLSLAILRLFDLEIYNAFIYDTFDKEFADKFSNVKNENEFRELIGEYGLNDLYKSGYLSPREGMLKSHIDRDSDRYIAIQYTDKNGKTVIERLYCKDVYIINNNGKTVEAYRTNFCS